MSFPASTSPGWEVGSCLSPLGQQPTAPRFDIARIMGIPSRRSSVPELLPQAASHPMGASGWSWGQPAHRP